MVQQMIDKISEYRLVNGATTAMPAGDKQYPVTTKKMALRELPNQSGNIINKSPGNSPFSKEKGHNPDSGKVPSSGSNRSVGIKRQQPDNPSSPCNNQTPGKAVTNVNLVYVRRKLESENGKAGRSVNINDAASPEGKGVSQTRIKEANTQPGLKLEPNTSASQAHEPVMVAYCATSCDGPSVAHSAEMPFPSSLRPEPYDSVAAVPLTANDSNGYHDYKERFVRLQTFLKSCDQSSQEEYIHMLRSLSSAGRSRHAVELERRAVFLLLEEGKELHRMSVLNVLGKASPSHNSISSPASRLQAQSQRGEKA